jgi:hypothetical protein
MTKEDLRKQIVDTQRSVVLAQEPYGKDIGVGQLKDILIGVVRAQVKDFWLNDYFMPSSDEQYLIDAIHEGLSRYSHFLNDGRPSLAHN